jgi:hypothetical protein
VGDSAFGRVSGVAAEQFAKQHWARNPLLSPAAQLRGSVAELFDASAVDELVSRRGLRTPFLRMAKDGVVIPAQRFTRGGGAGATVADQVADDKVLALIDDGATLVLQALHRSWPPLVSFGAQLAQELGHPVQINAYITPSQSRGFAAHYDVHDVFVLQVAGHKQWLIHPPVHTDPLADQNWEKRRDAVAERAAEPPIIDTVLSPGDALYLPRGYLHSALALGQTSIHLTIGVHPVTRYHLVEALLEAAREDPELRTSLPMGTALDDPAVIAPLLADTVARLSARLAVIGPEQVAGAIGAGLNTRTRPEPLAPLASLSAARELRPDSELRLRGGLRAQVRADAEQLRITFVDRHIVLSASYEVAVKAVLGSAGVIRPVELPGLDADEQLALAGRLLREGILVPAGEAAEHMP